MPENLTDSEPRFRGTSEDLRETRVVAALSAPLEAKKSLLCAGSFGLAWRALEEVAGGRADIEGAEAFSEAVRASACERSDVDEASYLAKAVTGPEGLSELKRELEAKLGDSATPRLLPQKLLPDTLLVYAYLWKQLALATPLARDDEGYLYFDRRPVASFGVWDCDDKALWDARAEQVRIVDHAGDSDFVIELLTRSREDRLLLARVPPAATLQATVDSVLARAPDDVPFLKRAFGATRLRRGEQLKVPVLDFEVSHHFREIENRRVLPLGRQLALAEQLVRLRLDENGALLKSEVVMEMPKSRWSRLRSFVFDGPFLLLMIRRGAKRPYLAMWVETPELMARPKRA